MIINKTTQLSPNEVEIKQLYMKVTVQPSTKNKTCIAWTLSIALKAVH